MGVWKIARTVAELNEISKNTLHEHLGIEFIEIGDNYLKARMPVNSRVRQPHGILHGGASAALAETTGSMASEMCVEPGKRCVGLSIESKHLRPAKEGYVYCVARPIHIGRLIQLWDVEIKNEGEQMVCASRLTMAVL